jgi:hypothetical protein
MSAAIDHVFILCSVGAVPEAEALLGLGLEEGTPNTHPGQGTACRRFFFSNAYLELLWVSDPVEAQGEIPRPVGLWERWRGRERGACPYGIVLRPGDDVVEPRPPFPTWAYTPGYMPAGIAIDVAREDSPREPAFFYLGFQRGRPRGTTPPIRHDLPARSLTGVTVRGPAVGRSEAARVAQAAGLVVFRDADEYLLELQLDAGARGRADLRPVLSLAIRW